MFHVLKSFDVDIRTLGLVAESEMKAHSNE